MSDFLLTQIINYGAPIIGIVILLGAIGIPMPGTLSIVAAGAFSNQGILSWPVTALIGLTSAVIGDSISYAMGYYARERILKRYSQTAVWKQASQSFQHWGGMSIFFSRFLVTAIAIPVNLIAGSGDFSYLRFIGYDIAGETIWIFGFGGLGYIFSNKWELVSNLLSNFGGLMLGVLFLGIGTWLVISRKKKQL